MSSLPATHFFHDENYIVHSRFLLFICLAVFRFISSITHTSTTLPVLPSTEYTLKPRGQPPFSPQPLSLISLMHGLLYINPPLLKRRISILLGRGWLVGTRAPRGCRPAERLSDLLCGTHQFTSDSWGPFLCPSFHSFGLILLYFWNTSYPSTAVYGMGPVTF